MNCRCTLVGAVDGFGTDDARRWSRLPDGMTYEQWKGEGLRRKQPTESARRRASMKPVNEKLYASQRNYVERHGGVVMRGGMDVERYLDNARADAANFGDVIMLRESPTTSEVLEEVHHFKQHRRGDYSDCGAEEMIARREIDTQKYLIGVAKRYNIPESETEQTKQALTEYERKLEELVRRNREG